MSVAEVGAVVVTYRSRNHVDRCLNSLLDNGVECIWVVDNASDDGTADHVARHFPQVRLIRNAMNLGFAAANNQALVRMDTPFSLLINPDAWLEPGAVQGMLGCMRSHPDVAVVGPRIIRSGEVEPSLLMAPNFLSSLLFLASGMRAYGTGGFAGRAAPGYPWHGGGEGDHVRGSCMMVRMQAVQDAGFLDEQFFLYFEETEWCLRLRRHGWRVRLAPKSVAHHVGKASVRTEEHLPSIEFMRSAILFWGCIFGHWRALVLRAALMLMAGGKWLALALIRRSPAKRRWLFDVMRLSRNPYALSIPYPGAKRPECWPEEDANA